jgi:ribonuclease E
MLINAQRPEEARVAVVSDRTLDAYDVSAAESGLRRGNIYRAIVANLQPSLDAAFVDFGDDKDGLLRAEDVVPSAAHRKIDKGRRRPRIDQLLERGRPILVQVVRDAIGKKGALVTTNLSIAGRYLVFMPYDETRGVSRKLDEEATRQSIRERLGQLELPEGSGVIVRTNAGDQPKTALNRDLSALLRLWKKVRSEASSGKGPKLLYSDQDLILQVLRDSLDSSIHEVLVDDDEAYDKVRAYMRTFMPRAKTRLVRYAERMPLFSRFELETQIDRIYQRKVDLPSGGSIVIDGTEALTAIDVNSGRSRGGSSQEDTAVDTNLEAAREVGRQLRMRDIGGLVVVDFIDMRSMKHRRDVERETREAMKDDRARFTVSRISANGLLEVNRQRLKKELKLRTHRPCPTCGGTGSLANPELVGLNLLRRIETRAVTGRLKGVRVELHPELADAIQNERRDELAALEREFEIKVEIIAATSRHRSEEHIDWFQRAEHEQPDTTTPAVTVADLADGAGRRTKRAKETDTPAAQPEQKAPGTEDRDTAKPKKRRRGGRRRKKSSASAAETETAAPKNEAPEAAPAPDTASPQPPSGSHSEQPEAGKTKTKRRPRRRRRRKSPKPAAEE